MGIYLRTFVAPTGCLDNLTNDAFRLKLNSQVVLVLRNQEQFPSAEENKQIHKNGLKSSPTVNTPGDKRVT